MTDHPKIIALEKLLSERRMLLVKTLLKEIDADLMRLDELDKKVPPPPDPPSSKK